MNYRSVLLQGSAWILLAFLFLPLLVVIPVSFTDQSYLSLPQHALSLRHYQAVLADPTWMWALGQTLVVAILSAALATVAGGMAALVCWQSKNDLTWLLRGLVLAPLVVPTVVSGLGFFNLWAWLGLLDTYTGIIITYAILTIPYTFTTISASLLLFDPRVEQAARNLGASPAVAILTIIMPAARAGLLSGFLFAFVYVWDEVVVLLFVSSRKIRLLSRLIWEGLQNNVDPSIAVVSTLLTVVTAAAIILIGIAQFRNASSDPHAT